MYLLRKSRLLQIDTNGRKIPFNSRGGDFSPSLFVLRDWRARGATGATGGAYGTAWGSVLLLRARPRAAALWRSPLSWGAAGCAVRPRPFSSVRRLALCGRAPLPVRAWPPPWAGRCLAFVCLKGSGVSPAAAGVARARRCPQRAFVPRPILNPCGHRLPLRLSGHRVPRSLCSSPRGAWLLRRRIAVGCVGCVFCGRAFVSTRKLAPDARPERCGAGAG